MKKIKKFSIGIGAFATILAPATIVACGDDKTEFDFMTDLAKIELQQTSTKNKAALKTAVGTKEVGDAVIISELGITAPKLSTGVVATYAVKTVYSTEMGTIVVTATLTKGDETETKDITIKAFTFVDDLAKIELQQTSTKNKAALKTAVGTKEIGDAVIITELGITAPKLSTGVVATYAIKKVYQTIPGVSIVEVTLTKGTQTATKIFSITTKMFDFIADKNKFVSFQSTKDLNELKTIFVGETPFISTKKVTAQELGITTPNLSPDVSVEYTYMTKSGYVFLILVTFTKDTEEAAKGIRVIAQSSTLSNDITEISEDLTSIKNKVDFNNDIGSKIMGESITEDELGLLSFLPSDVTATYVVKTIYDENTSKIIVTMTLTKGSVSAEKELSIMAKIPSEQKISDVR